MRTETIILADSSTRFGDLKFIQRAILLEEAMDKNNIFFVINEISEALSLSNQPKFILDSALDAMLETMKIDACWIQLPNLENNKLSLAAYRGFSQEMERELDSMDLEHSFSSKLLGAGDKVIISDLPRDDKFSFPSFVKEGLRSLIAVPLRTYHISGVLGVAFREPKGFDKDFVDLLMLIGNLVCGALDKARLWQSLSSTKTELKGEAKFDILELEKMAAKAEVYYSAAHMAVEEAAILARKLGKEQKPPAEMSGEEQDRRVEEIAELSRRENDEAVKRTEEEYIESAGEKQETQITPQVLESTFNAHAQKMKEFNKSHQIDDFH